MSATFLIPFRFSKSVTLLEIQVVDLELFFIVYVINFISDSTALSCAKLMWDMGSKNPVKVIKGSHKFAVFNFHVILLHKVMGMHKNMPQYFIVEHGKNIEQQNGSTEQSKF